MSEKFFLTYANQSLREAPVYLYVLVSEIIYDEANFIQEAADLYGKIIVAILSIGKDKEYNSKADPFGIKKFLAIANDIPYQNRKKLRTEIMSQCGSRYISNKDLGLFFGVYDMAYQTVYGHDFPICVSPLLELREELFGPASFRGPKRLKCYECDQLHFVHILSEIVKGKEYNSIDLFEYLIDLMNDHIKIRRETELTKKKNRKCNAYKISFQNKEFIEIPLKFGGKKVNGINYYNGFTPFRLNLISMATNSLTKYLHDNDRRRLKRCSQCEKFYIAKTIRRDQKYCSPECKRASNWTPETWAEFMRTYRAKKKLKAEEVMKELRQREIERRMKILDLTREEVIEQMEADELMD